MALIDCGECGNRISDKAASCPGCGAPVELALPPTPAQQASPQQAKGDGSGTLLRVFGLLGLGVVAVPILLQLVGSAADERKARTQAVIAAEQAAQAPARRPEPTAKELRDSFSDAFEKGHWATAIGRGQELTRRYPGSDEARGVAELIATAEQNAEEHRLAGLWRYSATDDDMSSGKVRTAAIRSKNEVELGFPYQGKQRATLTLRRHPRHGNDAILGIERGQILCSTYSCDVSVRFDDGQARQFGGNPSSSHDSTLVFLKQFQTFLTGLRGSRTVRIQPAIYQHGGIVFEFETGGFDPEKFK